MIQIKKILFPTSFSERSRQSLAYSLHLANKYKAELHMLHALVLWEDDPHNPAYHFPDKEELQTRLKDAAANQMTSDLEKSEVKDIVIKQVYERGMTPSETIIRYAGKNDIDLIVMDTHHKRGMRLLFGSAVEEVVREAPSSVLAIYHKKGKEPKFALYSSQNIL
ncbi:MAG: universal stress protein [Desulfobacula sp.]|nr:universal stress protein [Desulfobacula sp.]